MKQLQYLLALQDQQSFSGAAEACNVTQSTLSAGIATLEELLRQKVADRSQKRISLTPLGLEIAEKARGIVDAAGALVTRARSMDEPLTGPLRLGIIPTIAPYLLPRILPGLQQRFPRLELQLHEDLSQRLVESARAGRLDLILLAFPFDTPGMEQTELFQERFVLACPKGRYPGRTSVSAAELEGETLLLLDEGHCLRDHALAACKLAAPRERKAFSATSLPTLIQMVGHGYGVTLLPEMAADALPDTIELTRLTGPDPVRTIGLAWRQGCPQARDFRLLGKIIKILIKL